MDWLLLAADSSPGHDAGSSSTVWMIVLAIFLVVLNGFFVAAEFALVKIRPSQIDKMVRDQKPFAKSAQWLARRMDHALSGITMASLALGWVGEPAFAKLIEPAWLWFGGEAGSNAQHIVAFIIAFSVITSLHLVVGEQAPKIFAIRRPDPMVRWCAPLMQFFYYFLFPFMWVLNWVTEIVLSWFGLGGDSGHGSVMTEEEIRTMLRESHSHGHLTLSEHSLINAVFEFDDLVCRLVMVPRGEVHFLDINEAFPEQLARAKEFKHTRYPVCNGSLDEVLGVVHMKDVLGVAHDDSSFDIRTVMREPTKVPDTMPISQVLRHIQSTHQLLTFVIDEYGTTVGIITLENILEKIVGPVDDEFDTVDEPDIQKMTDGRFMVSGSTPISEVEKALGLNLDDADVDTVAGVLMARSGKVPEKGDRVEFEGAVAEIVEGKDGD